MYRSSGGSAIDTRSGHVRGRRGGHGPGGRPVDWMMRSGSAPTFRDDVGRSEDLGSELQFDPASRRSRNNDCGRSVTQPVERTADDPKPPSTVGFGPGGDTHGRDGLPVQRAVWRMGACTRHYESLLPWMTLAVHVSITRSSTSPYNITRLGNGVFCGEFHSRRAGFGTTRRARSRPRRRRSGSGWPTPQGGCLRGHHGGRRPGGRRPRLLPPPLGGFHPLIRCKHQYGDETSSVSLTPAVGGWITIVAILALLAWAVMNGSSSASRRETRSRSKARGMDPAVAPPETGFAMASPGESVGGADPSMSRFLPSPQALRPQCTVAPLSIPVTDPAAPARPAGWYPTRRRHQAALPRRHSWTQHTAPRDR